MKSEIRFPGDVYVPLALSPADFGFSLWRFPNGFFEEIKAGRVEGKC